MSGRRHRQRGGRSTRDARGRGDPRKFRAWGLPLYMRSDLGITIATGVSAWADQGGSTNNGTNAAALQQPVYTASDATYYNRPTLQFTGDAVNPSNLALATLIDNPSTSTVFAACSYPTNGASYQSILSTKQYTAIMRSNATNAIGYFFDVDSQSATVGNATAKIVEWAVRAANDADVVINGTSQTVVAGTAYRAAAQSFIGYGGGGLDTAAGVRKIAEIAVFASTMTPSARTRVRRAFGARYGIAVAA